MTTDDAVAELRRQLDPAKVLTDEAVRHGLSRDRSQWVQPELAAVVVKPADESDVVTTLKVAHHYRLPVIPRGAGSGLSGGTVGLNEAIVLDVTEMASVIELDPRGKWATVQPGVITADLDRQAAEHGLMFAPDPASTELSTIGGNIAANAGGLRCVKYGNTRDSVLSLKVVLATGEKLTLGSKTKKDVAGLDLMSLFVGSEGTLGVITEATVRLVPRPAQRRMLLAVCRTWEEVEALAVTASAMPQTPSMVELIDRGGLQNRPEELKAPLGLEDTGRAVALIESDSPHAEQDVAEYRRELTAAGLSDLRLLSDQEREAALRLRRGKAAEGKGDAQILDTSRLWWLGEDMTVPAPYLARFLREAETIAAEAGVRISMVAHVGDGNLHPALTIPKEEVSSEQTASEMLNQTADRLVRIALSLGGSVTGEHGVGVLKKEWLPVMLGEESLRIQHSIKEIFDPHGIMNPGRGY